MEFHLHLNGEADTEPNTAVGAEAETVVSILQDELRSARTQTAQADVKAGLLGSGVFAGFAVAFASGSAADLSATGKTLAWVTAVGAALVLMALGFAVWPRPGKRQHRVALRDSEEILAEARLKATDTARFERALALELEAVRRIAHWKFVWLRVSIVGTGLLLLLIGSALLTSA